jgi:hypothetical protein
MGERGRRPLIRGVVESQAGRAQWGDTTPCGGLIDHSLTTGLEPRSS